MDKQIDKYRDTLIYIQTDKQREGNIQICINVYFIQIKIISTYEYNTKQIDKKIDLNRFFVNLVLQIYISHFYDKWLSYV